MALIKPYLVTIAFLLFISKAEAQFGYGGELGLGMSNMRFAPNVGFTSASKQPIFSGKAGGIIDAGINKHIYFQSGILCSFKGHKRQFSFYVSDSVNAAADQTLHLTYIDVPLNICYKTNQVGNGCIILGMGATLSYLLGGSNQYTYQGVDSGIHFYNTHNEKVSDNNPLKAFDVGVSLFAGYEMRTGWFFRCYYTAGVSDIGLNSEIDKNRMLGVSGGYLLGKKRIVKDKDDDLIDRSKD